MVNGKLLIVNDKLIIMNYPAQAGQVNCELTDCFFSLRYFATYFARLSV